LADLPDFHAKVVEDLGSQAFTLTEQAQEQVLGTDIAVVRSFCFFLSERQNLLGALSKSLKRIQGSFLLGSYGLGGASTSSNVLGYPAVPLHLI